MTKSFSTRMHAREFHQRLAIAFYSKPHIVRTQCSNGVQVKCKLFPLAVQTTQTIHGIRTVPNCNHNHLKHADNRLDIMQCLHRMHMQVVSIVRRQRHHLHRGRIIREHCRHIRDVHRNEIIAPRVHRHGSVVAETTMMPKRGADDARKKETANVINANKVWSVVTVVRFVALHRNVDALDRSRATWFKCRRFHWICESVEFLSMWRDSNLNFYLQCGSRCVGIASTIQQFVYSIGFLLLAHTLVGIVSASCTVLIAEAVRFSYFQ